jgi:hypothetical protein
VLSRKIIDFSTVYDFFSEQVKTIVGHGLFEFGHQDGNLDDALLQHPLGLCAIRDTIFVADTYNSAIRIIDLKNSGGNIDWQNRKKSSMPSW